MRLAILALALLSACSGGGSRSESFTPSSDLLGTHEWLHALWNGIYRSNSGGPPFEAILSVTQPLANAHASSWASSVLLSLLYVGDGDLMASGNRVRVSTIGTYNPDHRCVLDLMRTDEDQMAGTFVLTDEDGAVVDVGAVQLERVEER